MIARCTIMLALLAIASLASAQETSNPPAADPTTSNPPAVSDSKPAADPVTEPVTEPAADPVANAEAAAPAADDSLRMKELLSLVQDNTLAIHRREHPAFFLLMKDVVDRSTEQLKEAITLNPRFNDLYKDPGKYRGELVTVKLNARRVLPVNYTSKNAAGVSRVYEIWGWTQEAKAWMYCCVVPELPEGFPVADDINEHIELTGYFFKMQAYQPGNAAPNARNLVAPLIIGRIIDAGPLPAKANASLGSWPLILIMGFVGIVMFRIMMHMRGIGRRPILHRNYRRRSLEPIDQDVFEDGIAAPDRGIRIRNANEA